MSPNTNAAIKPAITLYRTTSMPIDDAATSSSRIAANATPNREFTSQTYITSSATSSPTIR